MKEKLKMQPLISMKLNYKVAIVACKAHITRLKV